MGKKITSRKGESGDDDQPPYKLSRCEESESDVDDEEEGFHILANRVYEKYDKAFGDKVDQLRTYMSEDAARTEVNVILRPKYKKALVKEYKSLVQLMNDMKSSPTHKKIEESLHEYLDKGYSFDKALDRAIHENKYMFDALLEKFDEESEDSESEEEDENPEEEDDDETEEESESEDV